VLNLTGLALTPGSQRSWWLREALDQEEEGCPPLGRADRGCAGRLIDVSPTRMPTVGASTPTTCTPRPNGIPV